MPRLESAKRFWLYTIPGSLLIGLILGGLISIPVVQKPKIATITISGKILEQAYTDDILDMLSYARDDDSVKAVVLLIDSPGGYVVTVDPIYLDVLRLRQQKPVVASIGMVGASGGYRIAVASNFIYAQPASQLGSVGVGVLLPTPEELDEDFVTTGPFKVPLQSRRKALSGLETLKQQFVDAVISQRGEQLKLSEEELSQAAIYTGIEGLRYGLIDDIGTKTDAIEKAAQLAHIRNYEVVELYIPQPVTLVFGSSDLEALKSQTSLIPIYYYLYFESE